MGTLYDRAKAEETAREFIDFFDLQLWPRPIPISELMPEHGATVLWWCSDDWERGTYDAVNNRYSPDYGGYGSQEINESVTHWLPIPPPPTQASSATEPSSPEPRA